jgi:hypothetical protein
VFSNIERERNETMNAKKTKKTTKPSETTLKFLMSPGRWGRRKIETLSWKRLAAIYDANRPGGAVRKAINREARRCGYTPSTILALNAE